MKSGRPMRQMIAIGAILAAQLLLSAPVEAADTLVIRNVRLVDREGEAEDVVVNIMVRDRKLDVISQDEFPVPEGALVLDGRNGVVLGKLALGEPASFLILDEDPRENVEVLLDTRTHARFAIHDGEILRNELQESAAAEAKPPKRGWLAYSPPPMALPLSYRDAKKWNRWEGKYVSGIFLAAVVLDRQNWFSQDEDSSQQVGDLEDYESGEVRGLRVGAVGTLNFNKPWVYTIFVATNSFDRGFDSERDDDLTFFDYRLDIPLPGKTTLSVGKQKEPISLERVTSMVFLPMQERSAVADALLPSRNFGAVLSGTALDRRMTWAGGAFDDSFVTGDSFGNSSRQLVGRVTWLPFLTEDESALLHVGLGARYSDARQGGQALTEPEFNNAPLFVDTGLIDADDLTLYDLELSWRKGRLWTAGEYIWTRADSPALGDPEFDGFYLTAAWSLTGEMRPYNRKSGIFDRQPIAKSVYQGGRGAWEVGARWSELDLTDGMVEGGEMEILSLGLTWWLSPIFHVSVNFRDVNLDRLGLEGDSQGFNTRVLLMLE